MASEINIDKGLIQNNYFTNKLGSLVEIDGEEANSTSTLGSGRPSCE